MKNLPSLIYYTLKFALRSLSPARKRIEGAKAAPYAEIPAEEAANLLARSNGYFVLDVRTPREWAGGHIPGATLIPVQELGQRLDELPADRRTPILCICAMGGRSAVACEMLAAAGYTALVNAAGGMKAYTGETATG